MAHRFRPRRWMIVTGAAVFALIAASLAVRVPFSSEMLRARVVATLAERLNAEVELGTLTLRIFPRFQARGEKLVVRYKGRDDIPPLFTVSAFTVDADLPGLWRRHVAHVNLEGLEIHIPPRDGSSASGSPSPAGGSHLVEGRQVIVDVLEAPGSKLVMLPRRADRPPRIWNLHELRLQSVGVNTPMQFRGVLTNAVPPGFIFTQGSFGPWHRDDPGHTPLSGEFTFDHADLGVFKGIGGTLAAAGTYGGALERIEIHGRTETPDFVVNISGHKVLLKTTYHAIVDGTNADTSLERVDAAFLDTTLTAKGGVFHVDGVPGRVVRLDITSDTGRLEDFMRLAVRGPRPPMSGALRLTTSFELPPGDRDVVDKLRLNGRFLIQDGRFTNTDVQQRIDTLSRRARGKPIAEQQRVASSFAGDFALDAGVLTLRRLTFDVPGAVVDVKGRYGLRNETLAFAGDLVMDAKLSQTTSGFRSLLLRAVDPLFRREGRTVIPIRITGSRENPTFGMDVRRVFSRRPAAPGD